MGNKSSVKKDYPQCKELRMWPQLKTHFAVISIVDPETSQSKWDQVVSKWNKLVEGSESTKEPKQTSSIGFSQFKTLMSSQFALDTEDLKMMFKMYTHPELSDMVRCDVNGDGDVVWREFVYIMAALNSGKQHLPELNSTKACTHSLILF